MVLLELGFRGYLLLYRLEIKSRIRAADPT